MIEVSRHWVLDILCRDPRPSGNVHIGDSPRRLGIVKQQVSKLFLAFGVVASTAGRWQQYIKLLVLVG
jgi:hypothetical protein